MGRRPIDPEDVKRPLTIHIPLWKIKKIREIKGYNAVIERLIDRYFIEHNISKDVD